MFSSVTIKFVTARIEVSSHGNTRVPISPRSFSNSCEESEIYRIIDYLFRLRDEEWKNSISVYEKKLFFYDENNSKLKNFLKDYL